MHRHASLYLGGVHVTAHKTCGEAQETAGLHEECGEIAAGGAVVFQRFRGGENAPLLSPLITKAAIDLQVELLEQLQRLDLFSGLPERGEPIANTFDITGIEVLAKWRKLSPEVLLVGKGILCCLRKQDEVEGISLRNIESEVALDHHFRGEIDEVDKADVVFVEIAHPPQPVRRRDRKCTGLQADAVPFPRAHHQPVNAQGNLRRVAIARPVLNVNFQVGLSLRKAEMRSSIKPEGKIDGITDVNQCRVDLIGPDLKGGELCLAIDR